MKKGFVRLLSSDFSLKLVQVLKNCKEKCDYLIVGIPDDDCLYRLLDCPPVLSFSKRKEFLEAIKYVDEIYPISLDSFNLTDIINKISFDLYFLAENTDLPAGEKSLFDTKKIEVSVIGNLPTLLKNRTLCLSLQNIFANRKIILWGTGNYFNFYMDRYGENFPPLYAVDAAPEKKNQVIRGVKVCSPDAIQNENKDDVVVIICCKNYVSVISQLKNLGDYNFRTLSQDDELSIFDEYDYILNNEKVYLDNAHRILKILMKEFIGVCNKYNLKYYLTCGGLLGAVRHKSFIPWDDDIDFSIPYETYDFLRKNAKDIWANSDFEFVDFDQLGKNTFVDFIVRLIYKGEVIENRILKKGNVRNELKNHLCIDLFIINNASKNKNRHRRKIVFIDLLYALAMGHRAYIDYSEYASVQKIQLFGLKIVNYIGKVVPLRLIFKLFRDTFRYARKETTPDCFECNVSIKVVPQIFKWEQYGEGTSLFIDELEVKVPSDYDSWLLTRGYFNYMVPPPPNQRKPFHEKNAKGVMGY